MLTRTRLLSVSWLGGYSFHSLFHGHTFAGNAEAIAIEHGQNNLILGNVFTNDSVEIRLWPARTGAPA